MHVSTPPPPPPAALAGGYRLRAKALGLDRRPRLPKFNALLAVGLCIITWGALFAAEGDPIPAPAHDGDADDAVDDIARRSRDVLGGPIVDPPSGLDAEEESMAAAFGTRWAMEVALPGHRDIVAIENRRQGRRLLAPQRPRYEWLRQISRVLLPRSLTGDARRRRKRDRSRADRTQPHHHRVVPTRTADVCWPVAFPSIALLYHHHSSSSASSSDATATNATTSTTIDVATPFAGCSETVSPSALTEAVGQWVSSSSGRSNEGTNAFASAGLSTPRRVVAPMDSTAADLVLTLIVGSVGLREGDGERRGGGGVLPVVTGPGTPESVVALSLVLKATARRVHRQRVAKACGRAVGDPDLPVVPIPLVALEPDHGRHRSLLRTMSTMGDVLLADDAIETSAWRQRHGAGAPRTSHGQDVERLRKTIGDQSAVLPVGVAPMVHREERLLWGLGPQVLTLAHATRREVRNPAARPDPSAAAVAAAPQGIRPRRNPAIHCWVVAEEEAHQPPVAVATTSVVAEEEAVETRANRHAPKKPRKKGPPTALDACGLKRTVGGSGIGDDEGKSKGAPDLHDLYDHVPVRLLPLHHVVSDARTRAMETERLLRRGTTGSTRDRVDALKTPPRSDECAAAEEALQHGSSGVVFVLHVGAESAGLGHTRGSGWFDTQVMAVAAVAEFFHDGKEGSSNSHALVTVTRRHLEEEEEKEQEEGNSGGHGPEGSKDDLAAAVLERALCQMHRFSIRVLGYTRQVHPCDELLRSSCGGNTSTTGALGRWLRGAAHKEPNAEVSTAAAVTTTATTCWWHFAVDQDTQSQQHHHTSSSPKAPPAFFDQRAVDSAVSLLQSVAVPHGSSVGSPEYLGVLGQRAFDRAESVVDGQHAPEATRLAPTGSPEDGAAGRAVLISAIVVAVAVGGVLVRGVCRNFRSSSTRRHRSSGRPVAPA